MQLALEPELAPYVSPDADTPLGEEALARRAKAMACTVPLHQLEANKGRMRDGQFSAYTVWGLAFVAIDTVTVQMDFDRGAPHAARHSITLPPSPTSSRCLRCTRSRLQSSRTCAPAMSCRCWSRGRMARCSRQSCGTPRWVLRTPTASMRLPGVGRASTATTCSSLV